MSGDWLQNLRKNSVKQNNKFKQGTYTPINKEKYIGTNNPTCLSSYEFRCCNYLDTNINVVRWSSEIHEVKYKYSVDNKVHTYFPDFYAEIRDKNGNIQKYMIELKPSKSLIPPQKPKKQSAKAMKNYLYSLKEYVKNKNKWNSARLFCESQNMKFIVLTEKQLF